MHRGRLVDAAPDPGDDLVDDAHQVGIVLEARDGLLEEFDKLRDGGVTRLACGPGLVALSLSLAFGMDRDSEVSDLHAPRGVGRRHQQHVGWLQIAMDDPVVVRGFERVDDLPRDGQRVINRHRATRQAIGTHGMA